MATEEQNLAKLNQVRRSNLIKVVKGKLLGKILERVAVEIVEKMVKAIEDREKWVWPFALGLALLNDFLDLLVIGSIPIVGDLIDVLTALILLGFTFSLNATGPFLVMRIRLILLGLTLLELIPLMDIWPTWTIGILWTYYKVRKRAKIAEEGLEQLEKGRLDPEIAAEFAH